MRGFAHRTTVSDALGWLDAQVKPLSVERIGLNKAMDRVLGEAVQSDVDVPAFDRAMMDGFAIRASDTAGASIYNRLVLTVVGQSLPGRAFGGEVGSGQAVRIMTGAPMPRGSDAVLPAEKAQVEGDQVSAHGEVEPLKHVGRPGEDVAARSTVLSRGRCLRPQDLGVLSSIGVDRVPVVRRPQVRLVVTGNELLPPGTQPHGVHITDANSPMLAALVTRDGGETVHPGIVADEPAAICDAMHDDVDVVLVSGGSSVGQEDHAPSILAVHGELAIHGVAMRPSSPAGMGRLGSRLVFLLPGNPVSCLCAYDFFAGRAIRGMGGRDRDWPYRQVCLPLVRKLVSTVGRVDYARVRIRDGAVEPLAVSGASILSSTTRADGFVIVDMDSEGFGPGTEVVVWLYD